MREKTVTLTNQPFIDALVVLRIYAIIGNSRSIMLQLTKISLAAGLKLDT